MATAATTSTSTPAATAGLVSPSAQRRALAKPLKTPPLTVQLLTAGAAACVADIFTFPLDTAKVRLQVKAKVSLYKVALYKVARTQPWKC